MTHEELLKVFNDSVAEMEDWQIRIYVDYGADSDGFWKAELVRRHRARMSLVTSTEAIQKILNTEKD